MNKGRGTYMKNDKLNVFWLAATGAIILLIFASSIIIWLRYDKGQLIVISPPPTPQLKGEIYVDGAVGNPGSYPLKTGDSVDGILQACGGTVNDADVSQIYLYVPHSKELPATQKININRAEVWLLEALPNIGEVKAQAIYDYRRQNGPFRNVEEITKVPGINSSTFDKIKGLITVAEYR
jgi:competence protein ComEA